jgi:pimeloyl-ACP methyl ester carboxylesterase
VHMRVPQAGHFLHFENPDVVIRPILGLLAG